MRRSLAVFRGSPTTTLAAAHGFLGPAETLWVSDADGTPTAEVTRRLGGTWDAVVLDLHAGFDPDTLGRCQGFVGAGGALVLRMPEEPVRRAALAVHPYGREDVGTRMWDRLERALATMPRARFAPVRTFAATAEQDAVVDAIRARFTGPRPTRIALTADRGRGKSAALGRAAAGLGAVATSAHPDQAAEILRFAPDARWVDPLALARGEARAELLLVDEAAALSVPLLRALLDAPGVRHVAFASTVHGYEGHGRGFSLRFLPGVDGLERFTLSTPIRWAPGDPLEAFVHRVLLLDAEPLPPRNGPVEVGAVDPGSLDEDGLRAVFGLLVAAHYRTTPNDLMRLLDAPNLHLHGLFEGGVPAAVCLVAEEGGLPEEVARGLASGAFRVRGHALAETLAVHSGRPDAASLRMIRSVRTTAHPERRRRGYAGAVVDHVHAHWSPDLFGTLFGATPALLAFRRAQGYRLVRLGVSRNSRTGEPSAVMLRPVSAEGHALVDDLRRVLARDLPTQLALMEGDGLALSPALRDAVLADLPPPAPTTGETLAEAVRAYAHGPRPFDAAVTSIRAFVMKEGMNGLDEEAASLIRGRVLEGRPWAHLAAERGMSVPAVMRALRRAVRALSEGA